MNNELTLIGIVMTGFATVYGWLIKHCGNTKKHANCEQFVKEPLCAERGQRNDDEHKRLHYRVDEAIRKSDEQHADLKADMKAEFHEVKELIRNVR